MHIPCPISLQRVTFCDFLQLFWKSQIVTFYSYFGYWGGYRRVVTICVNWGRCIYHVKSHYNPPGHSAWLSPLSEIGSTGSSKLPRSGDVSCAGRSWVEVARHRSNRDLVENVVATTWITATQTLHFKPILGPIFGGKPGRLGTTYIWGWEHNMGRVSGVWRVSFGVAVA